MTPHIGMQVENGDKKVIKTFDFPVQEGICREETSEKMRFLLEKVVSEGGGNKAYIEGYEIGGKTATSQTLPVPHISTSPRFWGLHRRMIRKFWYL